MAKSPTPASEPAPKTELTRAQMLQMGQGAAPKPTPVEETSNGEDPQAEPESVPEQSGPDA